MLALRDGAGAIPGFTPFNVAAGLCPVYPETPGQQGTELVYVQWNQSFANVGRVVSTPQAWPGTGITGIYSPGDHARGGDPGHRPVAQFRDPAPLN